MLSRTLIARSILACGLLGTMSFVSAQQGDSNPAVPVQPQEQAKLTPAENVATFYLVPMFGQMGTDVHPAAYKDIFDDIKAKKPDVVVLLLKSADFDRQDYIPAEDPREFGIILIDDYRNLVQQFRDQIPSNIRQVMWVEDAVGISSLIAMAWPELYMKPTARLLGLSTLYEMSRRWADSDVRAKMVAAWTGIGKGFLEYGGHSMELGEAMMRPERLLSCSFVGRKVKWFMSNEGDVLLDDSPERVLGLNAKTAEDYEISKGTAETLEDLAFLLGYREFKIIHDVEGSSWEKYRTDWRRQLDNCTTWIEDYRMHMGRARGDEALKWLGAAKSDLEKILAAVERFEPVENRMAQMGVSKRFLTNSIDALKEQIVALKKQEKDNRGNRGTGGTRGGGGIRSF